MEPSRGTTTPSTPVGDGVVLRKRKGTETPGGQNSLEGKTSSTGEAGSRGQQQKGQSIMPVVLEEGAASSLEDSDLPPLPHPLVRFPVDGVKDFTFLVFDKLTITSKGENDKAKSPSDNTLAGSAQDLRQEGAVAAELPIEKVQAKVQLPEPVFRIIGNYNLKPAPPLPNAYAREIKGIECDDDSSVEYEVDEVDCAWLDLYNESAGRTNKDTKVTLEVMEVLMDKLEKESYLQMKSSGGDARPVIDEDAVCSICLDGECQNSNVILFCDMCNLAVHQECYGVPYIPEGQWLCRRCIRSPSRAVDCILCPNKGGAFKQTENGRWVHVVCALWIPEVWFANEVYLEPVDGIELIPASRWKLCCFICKDKGRGACIQCHKSSCYTAFHVTCAQQAGICMQMENAVIRSEETVRKKAFCDNHAPPDFIKNRDENSSHREKLRECRKLLAESRSAVPMVSLPTISPERLEEISSSVSIPRKDEFIKRLLAYWKLKRIQRNGVPLLRRLQAVSKDPATSSQNSTLPISSPSDNQSGSADSGYKDLLKVRQDMEKARILCEMIRKREKQKRELVLVKKEGWTLQAIPLHLLMHNVLKEIGERDSGKIFALPVDTEEVKDYLSIISHPMDLSTIKGKIDAFQYPNLKAMQTDFQLMIDNCLLYNFKDTIFYRAAIRVGDVGRMIFQEAERMEQQIAFGDDFDRNQSLQSTQSAFGGSNAEGQLTL